MGTKRWLDVVAASIVALNHFPSADPMTDLTVVIPVFNRATTIGHAIESVLQQRSFSIDPVRVVVVDDASTDALPDALQQFRTRITLIRHPENLGAAAARNTGIVATKSGYIAFLDADDVWLPTKLWKQTRTMQRNGWLACCTAYCYSLDHGLEVISPNYDTGEISLADSVWGCFAGPGSTLICDRKIFDEVGFFDTRLRRLEDWEWQLRLVHKHKYGFIGEPLSRVSKSRNRERESVYAALDIIRSVHRSDLPKSLHRKFDAAMDIERAAASFRAGKLVYAALPMLKAIVRAPFYNDALSVVFHNRYQWQKRSAS
jgi:glycosyltransferase involved in cell wall biosynthesis